MRCSARATPLPPDPTTNSCWRRRCTISAGPSRCARSIPGLPHEQAGEAFARARVGEGVAWLIGQHVPAKRYLVAVDEAYFGQLSPASVRSLERQGGPMDAAEVGQFRSHPRAEDAVALRRWDEAAKDAADPGLPVAELLRIFDRYRTARGHS
jgi:predicted HD phosphohydrolase